MKQNRCSISLFGSAVLCALLISSSHAQFLACDDCPYQCKLAGTTATILGISPMRNLNTTSQQLTWTMLVDETLSDEINGRPFDKTYLLGTPPSFDLNNTSGFDGCSLFFADAASKIAVSIRDPTPRNDTCPDILGNSCYGDLRAQARIEMNSLLLQSKNFENANATCSSLQQRLVADPPASCQPYLQGNGSWGLVVPQALTGPGAPVPLPKSDCYPVLNPSYDLRVVARTRDFVIGDYEFIAGGTTPIMTLFYNKSSKTISDVDLTCVRYAETTKYLRGGGYGPAGSGAALTSVSVLRSVSLFLGLAILLA